MSFKPVDAEQQRIVEGTVTAYGVIQYYTGQLLEGLKKYYALPHLRAQFSVDFAVEDNLHTSIKTPFGDARGRLVLQIVGTDIQGRYVFEKLVVSESGSDVWRPVWAIRISRTGVVALGDEGENFVDTEDTFSSSNEFNSAARSLLYRIGAEPAFLP